MTIPVGNLIFLVAFFLNSLVGFGGNLLALPLLLFILSPKVAVPLTVLLAAFLQTGLFLESAKKIEFKKVGVILAGVAPGVPLGALVLINLPSEVMKGVISILIMVSCVLLIKRRTRKIRKEYLGCSIIGFATGTIASSTGIGGPPLVLWGINQQWSEEKLRANLIGCLTGTALVLVPVYVSYGLIDMSLLKLASYLLPGVASGFLLGIILKNKVLDRQRLLTRIAIGLLLTTASMQLARTCFVALL